MTARVSGRAVNTFVAVVVVAGLASLALMLRATWHAGLGDLRLLALSMAALALMSISPVVFEFKGEAGHFNLEEVFFAVLVKEALQSLVQLRELGVRVAIDDFGTGYSSLSRLRTMPFDMVKIDQSFVREIVHRQSAVPLVTSAITMAHGLGLQTVAEGIETPQQLAFLTEKGCDIGQGYLFGRPVAADKLRPGRRQWAPPAESVSAG